MRFNDTPCASDPKKMHHRMTVLNGLEGSILNKCFNYSETSIHNFCWVFHKEVIDMGK